MVNIVTTRIESDTYLRFEELSEKTDRTKSYLFRKALENAIADLEEYYAVEEAYNKNKSDKTKYYSI